MNDSIVVHFWGLGGAFPAPGQDTVRYGGDTSCVSVMFPGEQLIILDAGSGLIRFDREGLVQRQEIINADIFITHPHWDHIHGLPFFTPLYRQQNTINIYGPKQPEHSVEQLLSTQMNGIFFPVRFEDLGAAVHCHDLLPGDTVNRGDVRIKTIQLQHPSITLGYQLEYHGRSICFITDNELYDMDHPKYNAKFVAALQQFVQGTDVLIMDATYTDEEYEHHIGWGHSRVSQVTQFAAAAGVSKVCLFHHDRLQSDAIIDTKLAVAKEQLSNLGSSTTCIAPIAGESLLI